MKGIILEPNPVKEVSINKDDTILNTQLSDVSEYVEYLEKLVVDYKKYIKINKI